MKKYLVCALPLLSLACQEPIPEPTKTEVLSITAPAVITPADDRSQEELIKADDSRRQRRANLHKGIAQHLKAPKVMKLSDADTKALLQRIKNDSKIAHDNNETALASH